MLWVAVPAMAFDVVTEGNSYVLTRKVFLISIAFVYFCAISSIYVQIPVSGNLPSNAISGYSIHC